LISLYILVFIYPAGVSDTLQVLLGYRAECYKYKADHVQYHNYLWLIKALL